MSAENLSALAADDARPSRKGNSGQWAPPIDFPTELYGPSAPLVAFPDEVAAYVEELEEVIKAPVDIIAACADGVLAAAAARRAEVAIGDTHVEPLNTYYMPIAAPGERKFVLRDLIRPIEEE